MCGGKAFSLEDAIFDAHALGLEFTDNVEQASKTKVHGPDQRNAMAGAAINTNMTAITNFAAAGI